MSCCNISQELYKRNTFIRILLSCLIRNYRQQVSQRMKNLEQQSRGNYGQIFYSVREIQYDNPNHYEVFGFMNGVNADLETSTHNTSDLIRVNASAKMKARYSSARTTKRDLKFWNSYLGTGRNCL